MENPIRKIFSDMSNDELLQGISEILDSEKSGVIPLDSVIRKYCDLCKEHTQSSSSSLELFMTTTNILREGSIRFRNLYEVAMCHY